MLLDASLRPNFAKKPDPVIMSAKAQFVYKQGFHVNKTFSGYVNTRIDFYSTSYYYKQLS